MYGALRDDGASTQKAARTSKAAVNTSRSEVGRKGGKARDYEEWSKDALVVRAREMGVERGSRMTKAELIDALRHH